jgi:hypothetical protein
MHTNSAVCVSGVEGEISAKIWGRPTSPDWEEETEMPMSDVGSLGGGVESFPDVFPDVITSGVLGQKDDVHCGRLTSADFLGRGVVSEGQIRSF